VELKVEWKGSNPQFLWVNDWLRGGVRPKGNGYWGWLMHQGDTPIDVYADTMEDCMEALVNAYIVIRIGESCGT
jgi:hypothetical protein